MRWESIADTIWKAIQENSLLLTAVGTAFLMSALRATQKSGKISWIEAIMCGLFTFCIWFILGLAKLPSGAAVTIGGVIGYKGTQWFAVRFTTKFGGKSNG